MAVLLNMLSLSFCLKAGNIKFAGFLFSAGLPKADMLIFMPVKTNAITHG